MIRILLATVSVTFALCGSALAESEPCEVPHVTSILPSPDANDVPTNARVLVEVTGDIGCFGDEPTFRLTTDGDPLAFEQRVWDAGYGKTRVFALEPMTRLAANAEYTVEILGLDGTSGRGEFYRFGTGHDALHATTEKPRLRILSAQYDEDSGDSATYEVTVEVAPTSDSAPFDQLRVGLDLGGDASRDEADYPLTVVPDPDGWSSQSTFVQAGPTAEQICVLVRQQDIAGQWSEASRACAETVPVAGLDADESDTRGCLAAPGAGSHGWFALLLLPLLGLRRRR